VQTSGVGTETANSAEAKVRLIVLRAARSSRSLAQLRVGNGDETSKDLRRMWPFRRKRTQPLMLAKPDPERGGLLLSQLRDMQTYGWDRSGSYDPVAFLDSLPPDNAAPRLTDRLGD
jgi:hypothetical protein